MQCYNIIAKKIQYEVKLIKFVFYIFAMHLLEILVFLIVQNLLKNLRF